MTRRALIDQIKKKKSFLSIGLDTDINLIPSFLHSYPDPVYEFNKRIIDATEDLCIAYKPNSAFYECRGLAGWQSLIQTVNYIPKTCLSIMDAKRGDIGNTTKMYAQAFFNKTLSGMSVDALTVAPYMGQDSVQPFLNFENKWVILLALTSNASSQDFQMINTTNNNFLYENVLKKAVSWASNEQLMFVVGATQGKAFRKIREHASDYFLLVPGIGAQGGSLKDVCEHGITKDCDLIVNSSRSIIYASNGTDFAEKARTEALRLQQEMALQLKKYNIIK